MKQRLGHDQHQTINPDAEMWEIFRITAYLRAEGNSQSTALINQGSGRLYPLESLLFLVHIERPTSTDRSTLILPPRPLLAPSSSLFSLFFFFCLLQLSVPIRAMNFALYGSLVQSVLFASPCRHHVQVSIATQKTHPLTRL